jgi:hypothetical protein
MKYHTTVGTVPKFNIKIVERQILYLYHKYMIVERQILHLYHTYMIVERQILHLYHKYMIAHFPFLVQTLQ